RSVACFAAHADLGEPGVVAIRRGVVVSAQVGRVAVRAVLVPVVGRRRPVELVARSDALVGVQVKPASAASLLRARIERESKRLQMAVPDVDQILLQRLDPEGVLHFVDAPAARLASLAARNALGLDLVARFTAPKTGGLAEIPSDLVREIAEHR